MERIITSFDIGIRNLAYCRLSYQPNNISGNQFKIYDWNVIDLLDETAHLDKKCCLSYKSGSKSGTTCANEAYYYVVEQSGLEQPICRVHAKSYESRSLKRLYTCKNIALYELARIAIQKLDQIDFSQCEEVIFESQPRIGTPKMKNFSMMLFNYFIIRYIAEKSEAAQTIKDVKFVSSRNKLTIYDGPYIECKLKGQHSRNKFYGKAYCQYILRHNNEKLQFFNCFKKKTIWLTHFYKEHGT